MDATVTRAETKPLTGDVAVFAVAAEISVMFMGSTLLTPLYILYKRAFDFSEVTLTLVYAVYVVGNLSALLFLGRFSDQVGRRPATLPAFAAAAASTLIFLFAASTASLFLARALSGLAVGLASGTATAWIADFHGEGDNSRASTISASANMAGISLGPLVAGLLAEYAPAPLTLPYIVYFLLLAAVGYLVWRTPETVPRRRTATFSFRPRIGVPRDIRAPFIAPAVTAFATFALVGFYAALIPSLLAETMHVTNHAVGGLIAFEMFFVATLVIVLSRSLASRTAMIAGLVVFLPSLLLLVLAEVYGSVALLLAGTASGGISAALGYRGSLQVVNRIAPADRRAEVVSAYFAVGFTGNAVPIIGVGILSSLMGYRVASISFAVVLAVLAVVAVVTGTKFKPEE